MALIDCTTECGGLTLEQWTSAPPAETSFLLWCAIRNLGATVNTTDDTINVSFPGTGTGTVTLARTTFDGSTGGTVPAGWVALVMQTPGSNSSTLPVAGADFYPGTTEGYGTPQGYTGSAVTIGTNGEVNDLLIAGTLTIDP